MALDPESYGRDTAQTLVGGIEELKRELLGGGEASLEQQLQAGRVAVEALKQLLGGVTSDLLPPA